MASKTPKPKTYGFGVDPIQNQNHFFVVPYIPKQEKKTIISIYERYAWTSGNDQVLGSIDRLRTRLNITKWEAIKDALSTEFNTRLKKGGLSTGKFSKSAGTPVERLFGKEMMVLVWGTEDVDPEFITTAIRNWKGLMPEERWWLYTMTNASTGEMYDRRGWRKALQYILCENPVGV